MPEWLELELAEALRPAGAPPELWDRMFAPRRRVWAAWPIAAIVTLMIAAGTLWLMARGQEPPVNLQQLAIQQLRNPAPLGIRSGDPAEINRWLREQTGAELAIPAGTTVRLLGARMIRRHDARIGAVVYRAGNADATLLVARLGPSADAPHGRSSWRARGQSYALACADVKHAEAACLLCHTSL